MSQAGIVQTDILEKQLRNLVSESNSDVGFEKLKFNQQSVRRENMSLTGGNGRIWIQPSAIGYDVSLSGKSVEKELYETFKHIFGATHTGYKQSGSQPFWRTENFSLVKKAVHAYSQTEK